MFDLNDPNRVFDAVLFDMDGTVLTSIVAAERIWTQWADRHGLDADSFLSTIHGMRAVDTVRRLAPPDVDVEAEARAISEAEIADVDGIEAVPGAIDFVNALPPERWAIVTSAPRLLAERRIEAAGLPLPEVLISGDDVVNGKPAPDGFHQGAQRLGYPIANCLIFEDAPAGIRAGEAAGAPIVVVTATHASPTAIAHPTIAGYGELETRVATTGGLNIYRRPPA